ncbi:RNA polymerase sigma factor RpoD/SigA [Pseudomonas luteola]
MTAVAVAYANSHNDAKLIRRANTHDVLPHDELLRLARLAKNGDTKARNTIAEHNLRLVAYVATGYIKKFNIDFDDLYSQGVEGLMIAIDKFDPELGFTFSTYADRWIRTKIDELAMRNRTVHVPIHVVKAASRVQRTRRTLEGSHGRKVLDSEIASELGYEERAVRELTEAIQPQHSLDLVMGGDDEGSNLMDFLEDDSNPSGTVEMTDTMSKLKELISSSLNERERTIVNGYFGLDNNEEFNLAEIGRSLNLSRERVRQILRDSLQLLAVKLKAVGIDETCFA